MDQELWKYRIAITMLEGIGDIRAKNLIAFCGGAEAVFKEKKRNLLKIPGIGEGLVGSIRSQEVMAEAENEVLELERKGIKAFYFLDDDYPWRLKNCVDGPAIFYGKGNLDFNQERVISIVGTRMCTPYGRKLTESLIEGWQEFQPLIISGLAYGIDIAAHKAALNYQLPTVAVLAHGLDQVYPSLHRPVAEEMMGNGGLITDFRLGSPLEREHFPKRNRLVAGLSDATIVIESPKKGGSMITARIANSYNREVFAVPGRSGDKNSAGCNWLIKTNQGALLETPDDLPYYLGWEKKEAKESKAKTEWLNLDPEEARLVEVLRTLDLATVDRLCHETGFTSGETATLLLNLEFSGVVNALPGKQYELN